jgi:hypothetical protein
MSQGYEQEQTELKMKISFLSASMNEQTEKNDNAKRFISMVKRYTQLMELTPEILNECIDKIIVHAPDKSSGKRVVRLEIIFNFVGAVDTMQLAA